MKYSPNERQVVCVSWSDFTSSTFVSCVDRCLRLGHSDGRTWGIIRRRARNLILGTGGTSTRIEGHLTHQLGVRNKISLKYVEVISHRLRRRVRWAVSRRVICRDINILRIRRKTCAIKLHIFI
jgi:hypothetical protein